MYTYVYVTEKERKTLCTRGGEEKSPYEFSGQNDAFSYISIHPIGLEEKNVLRPKILTMAANIFRFTLGHYSLPNAIRMNEIGVLHQNSVPR